ncbi:hypothetical protein QR680_016122 [Steinernema hermaphroditum]|uniref:Uncharacterized protein n=1 Tax=Steinernema hermaphroditum TaxID=289476 RepID=A0AA39HAD9_9BILA|nr:hypothetical protein QR680_016122 [Steinernema hermaphroditum]
MKLCPSVQYIVQRANVKVSRECRIAAATPVVKEAAEDSVLSEEYIDDERDVNDGPKNRDRPEVPGPPSRDQEARRHGSGIPARMLNKSPPPFVVSWPAL